MKNPTQNINIYILYVWKIFVSKIYNNAWQHPNWLEKILSKVKATLSRMVGRMSLLQTLIREDSKENYAATEMIQTVFELIQN